MKLFLCQHCGQLLYFENRQCQNCFHRLGYLPAAGTLSAVEQDGPVVARLGLAHWPLPLLPNAAYDACNWLVPADSSEAFCAACRYNRTIPDLTRSDNLTRWRKFELAKHRLFYTLIRLGLPLPSRAEDPQRGLVFDFLADAPDASGHKVMTGHEDGLIAVNLSEADDAEREKLRLAMGETYRTLLGDLRHEAGHYFWDRLVRDAGRLEMFREFFGDERQDYQRVASGALRQRPTAKLATELYQRLRGGTSLGRFRRNLGALSAHRGHARNGFRVRYPHSARD